MNKYPVPLSVPAGGGDEPPPPFEQDKLARASAKKGTVHTSFRNPEIRIQHPPMVAVRTLAYISDVAYHFSAPMAFRVIGAMTEAGGLFPASSRCQLPGESSLRAGGGGLGDPSGPGGGGIRPFVGSETRPKRTVDVDGERYDFTDLLAGDFYP